MAAIDSLMSDQGADVYYSDGFRNVLEDHMTYLRTHQLTRVLDVTPKQAERFEYDLIGLLNELEVPVTLHWIVARMNHFDSIHEVPADLGSLLAPDPKEISKLLQSYNTTNKIN